MGKPRLFSTASVSAMGDPELTGQDWRVYLWVSLHDGMSLLKGKGAGCYASNKTLFEKVGCDYSSGCRSLSKLERRGHLVREKLGRSTRYRVTFPAPDNLQACNLSEDAIGDQAASKDEPITCSDFPETHGFPPETARDYSSLSEELDSLERGKLNSSEEAHHKFDAREFFGDQLGEVGKRDRAEARLGSEWRFVASLPRNFSRLPDGAKVSRIEEAFNAIGRDADRIDSRERETISQFLWGIYETYADESEPISQQAIRLHEELAPF